MQALVFWQSSNAVSHGAQPTELHACNERDARTERVPSMHSLYIVQLIPFSVQTHTVPFLYKNKLCEIQFDEAKTNLGGTG